MDNSSAEIAFAGALLAGNDAAEANEDLFAALVHRQTRFVFRVAFSVLRDPHDAEEVVQETFLRLYRNSAWREMRDERAFLACAAWRIAIDRLPKNRPVEAPGEFALASPEPGPEATLMKAEQIAAVHRLIDGLPEELRQPLALSTVEELSSREIADIMGIAEGTVRTRLWRARQILKHKLEKYGH
jgi:RNA polymerase sigma-70 factor (ECF subfamily)